MQTVNIPTIGDCQGKSPVRTVLLIEDERELHRAYRRYFEGIGFAVVSAYTGGQAVEAARAYGRRIDLVLLDMMLPDTGGKGVLETLQREGFIPGPPVIAMSASLWSSAEQDDIRNLGACAYIQKNTTTLEMLSKYIYRT